MKLKKGDKVRVITGKDKGKEGKILLIDRKNERVIVEGVNKIKKHIKAGADPSQQQGGIIETEAALHISNVSFLHKGKLSKIGIRVTEAEKDGKKIVKRQRFAKITGDIID